MAVEVENKLDLAKRDAAIEEIARNIENQYKALHTLTAAGSCLRKIRQPASKPRITQASPASVPDRFMGAVLAVCDRRQQVNLVWGP